MNTTEALSVGDVVQLCPGFKNPMFACCMVTVSELKPWGIQGYVQALGENGEMGGQAYIRATWSDIEFVGRTVWHAGSLEEKPETPSMAIGPEDLGEEAGTHVTCKICGREHPIEFGTDDGGNEVKSMGFYKCGDASYLASIGGKLIKR
jgi:hypothetical protein